MEATSKTARGGSKILEKKLLTFGEIMDRFENAKFQSLRRESQANAQMLKEIQRTKCQRSAFHRSPVSRGKGAVPCAEGFGRQLSWRTPRFLHTRFEGARDALPNRERNSVERTAKDLEGNL